REVLERERPSHLVAIERPGRGRSGDYLNARGVSVAEWNRPIDAMFGGPRPSASRPGGGRGARAGRRPVTIGVGDGGNEIGMGNVRTRLAREGPLVARSAPIVRAGRFGGAG